MRLSEVGVYTSLNEANLVAAKLAAHGIDAFVADGAAVSTIPTIEILERLRVVVRAEDRPRALEVLERLLGVGDDD